jgi:hypothetical protein
MPYKHAIVEVQGNGTCLWNAILTDLYLMQWFQRRDLRWRTENKIADPITPLHLKRWTMWFLATNSQTMVPGVTDEKSGAGQSYLEYFRWSQGAEFMTQFPYNLTSLVHHLNDVMLSCAPAASNTNAATQFQESYQISSAVRMLRAPRGTYPKAVLNEAIQLLAELSQKYKTARDNVYNLHYLSHCYKGTNLRTHSDEVQTRAVVQLLGGDIDLNVYTKDAQTWMEFNAFEDKNTDPLELFIFKNVNHYFSAVHIQEFDDSLIIGPAVDRKLRALKGVYEYPALNSLSLDRADGKRIGDEALQQRNEQDENFRIKDVRM